MLNEIQTRLQDLGLTQQTLLIIGVGLGAMLAIFGIAGSLAGRDPVLRRIAAQGSSARLSAVDAGLLRNADTDPKGLMKSLIPADRKERTQVQRQLAAAGMTGPHAVRNFYLARLALGFGMPMVLMALVAIARSHSVPLPSALAARLLSLSPLGLLQIMAILVGVGFFGPAYWLNSRIAARKQAIQLAFPNVLDLLQISVESGLGLDAAMIRVANETAKSAPEISEEILTAQLEIQAGRSRDKALTDMADRTGVVEVGSFVGVVLQSMQFGASISEALTTYSDEMRLTRELKAQEMANKLPVKMSGVMASLMLPSLLILALGPIVIRYIRAFSG
jgi:tight adherence protein C